MLSNFALCINRRHTSVWGWTVDPVASAGTVLTPTTTIRLDATASRYSAGVITIPMVSSPSSSVTHSASSMKIDANKKQFIATNYRRFNNTEMAQMLRCTPAIVGHHARVMGLVRSAEDERFLSERAVARWRATSDATNAHSRRSDTLRSLYKQELRRVLTGQEQQTNMRISTMPIRTRQVISRLVTRNHYRRSPRNEYELLVMPNTIRVREELYTNNYNLLFTDGKRPRLYPNDTY